MAIRRQIYPFQKVVYVNPKGIIRGRRDPVLPLIISSLHTSDHLIMPALIDTGADNSLFPSVIAKMLKHKLRSGRPKSFGSATGKGKAWEHTAKISILTADRKGIFHTIPQVPIDFIQKRKSLPLLLGVDGFLEKLVIKVDYPNKVVVIEVP